MPPALLPLIIGDPCPFAGSCMCCRCALLLLLCACGIGGIADAVAPSHCAALAALFATNMLVRCVCLCFSVCAWRGGAEQSRAEPAARERRLCLQKDRRKAGRSEQDTAQHTATRTGDHSSEQQGRTAPRGNELRVSLAMFPFNAFSITPSLHILPVPSYLAILRSLSFPCCARFSPWSCVAQFSSVRRRESSVGAQQHSHSKRVHTTDESAARELMRATRATADGRTDAQARSSAAPREPQRLPRSIAHFALCPRVLRVCVLPAVHFISSRSCADSALVTAARSASAASAPPASWPLALRRTSNIISCWRWIRRCPMQTSRKHTESWP